MSAALRADTWLAPFCAYEYTASARLHPKVQKPLLQNLDFLGRDLLAFPDGTVVLALRRDSVLTSLLWYARPMEEINATSASILLSTVASIFILGGAWYRTWLAPTLRYLVLFARKLLTALGLGDVDQAVVTGTVADKLGVGTPSVENALSMVEGSPLSPRWWSSLIDNLLQ